MNRVVIVMLCGLSLMSSAADSSSIFDDISNCDTGMIMQIVSIDEINQTNEEGRTPLMIAARRGDLAIVKLLVAKGADCNARDKFGFTVVDQIESIVRRTGTNQQERIVRMRAQGWSEDSISNLMTASSVVLDGANSTSIQEIQDVLNYLKHASSSGEETH